MLSPERWIRVCRRRLWGRELTLTLLAPLTAAVWSWAALVLAAKLWWPDAVLAALWSGIAMLPATLIWPFASRPVAVSRSDAAVWLDRELGTGGLVVALEEAPDHRWSALLPQAHQQWRECLPRWPWGQILQSLAWPGLFLAGALVVPARQPVEAAVVETTLGLETARELAVLAAALDTLPMFDPTEKAQLKAEIEALAIEARRAPLNHEKWETVDALRQRLQFRVNQTGSELGQAGQMLSLLMGALEAGGGGVTSDQQRRLEQQVLGVVQKFATPENLSRLPNLVEQPAVRELLQQGLTNLPSDPAQRKELLQDLQQAVTGEARNLESLQNLLPATGLSKSLASAAMGGTISSLLGGAGGMPALPGLTSPAGPLFGDAGRPSAERFRPRLAGTPPTPLAAPPVPVRPQPGQVVAGTRPTGEAWTRQVSPRHRAVVKQYFGDSAVNSPERN